MDPILSVQQLTKTFPRKRKQDKPFTAVDNVSFSMAEGEIVGLLGPNGAGKSTTIAMLLGALTPTSGTITMFGKNFLTHRSECAQEITFASSYIKLPWRLTVYENLRVYSLLYGIKRADFVKRIEKLLKHFGVWEQRYKAMSELSAGQITRIMLAKAFMPYPKLALLDEPTASLDPDIAHEVRAFIQDQQKEYGTTILYTSHNMNEVTELCKRVLFLKAGKIIAEDSPENLAKSAAVDSLEEYFLAMSRDTRKEQTL